MKRALTLAARGKGGTSPNPAVGAVVVRGRRIIAEGWHKKAGEPHAERIALEKAGVKAKGATLYVTLEPCCHHGKTPPCTDIIIQSGVSRVVTAVRDPFKKVSGKGIRILKQAGVEVIENVLREDAARLNEDFFTFHRYKRPFVTLKWAMSLDGRTSTDTAHSKWITSEKSRRYSHKLRSRYDAIVAGIGTVLADNPRLTVRLPRYRGRQPLRVILDPRLETPENAALFEDPSGIILAAGKRAARRSEHKHILKKKGAKILPIPLKNGSLSIIPLLRELYNKGVQSLYVEGGRRVAGSFFKSGYVDKIIVFMAPKIIGGIQATSPLIFKGPAETPRMGLLENIKTRRIDDDILIEGYVREDFRKKELT